MKGDFESGTAACWSSTVGASTEGVCSYPDAIDLVHTSHGQLLSRGQIQPAEHLDQVRFAGEVVAQFDGTAGMVAWVHRDHLGTPIARTAQDASLSWSGGLTPFGEAWAPGPANEPIRFPGQWADALWSESQPSLVYNLHRWYQPSTGRYNRYDPVGDVESRQDGPWYPRLGLERFSLYAYAESNPTSFIDPLGLLTFKGCDKNKAHALSNAMNKACSIVNQDSFEDCMLCHDEDSSVPERLRRMCERDNRTIRCVNERKGRCETEPPLLSCAWSIPFTRTIRMCPDAWEPGCDALSCTLVHEMTHQLGFMGESTPDAAEGCLNMDCNK